PPGPRTTATDHAGRIHRMARARHSIRALPWLCGLLAVVVALGLTWRSTQQRREPASIGMHTELGATAAKVNIRHLGGDYLAGEGAAEEKYRFKTVEVTGVLMGLDRTDPEVTTVIVGKQLGSRESPCACQGGRALERAAARRAEGKPITVRGKFAGMVMSRMAMLSW